MVARNMIVSCILLSFFLNERANTIDPINMPRKPIKRKCLVAGGSACCDAMFVTPDSICDTGSIAIVSPPARKLSASGFKIRNVYADDDVCPGTDCPQKNDFTKDRCLV
eukprot:30296_5